MTRKENISLIINSLVLFLTAFIVSYIPIQIVSYILTKLFQIPAKFDGYKLIYLISDASVLWNNISIITIFGLPPFVSLILANLTRRYYKKAKRKRGNMKLFLIWLSLCFDNLFWGAMIAGIVTSSEFAYFLNWIYIPKILQIIIALLGIILFITLGDFLKMAFLQTSPQRNFIDSENQRFYKIKIIFIPLILGILIFSLLGYPGNAIHEIILKLTIFFPLLKTLKIEDEENVKLVKNSKTFSIEWLLIIIIGIYFLIFNII